MEMVAMTRFDCMIGSGGLMRQALTQARTTARTARSAAASWPPSR